MKQQLIFLIIIPARDRFAQNKFSISTIIYCFSDCTSIGSPDFSTFMHLYNVLQWQGYNIPSIRTKNCLLQGPISKSTVNSSLNSLIFKIFTSISSDALTMYFPSELTLIDTTESVCPIKLYSSLRRLRFHSFTDCHLTHSL